MQNYLDCPIRYHRQLKKGRKQLIHEPYAVLKGLSDA